MRRLAWALTALDRHRSRPPRSRSRPPTTARAARGRGRGNRQPRRGDRVQPRLVAFAALGGLLASRRPRNPIGWLLCWRRCRSGSAARSPAGTSAPSTRSRDRRRRRTRCCGSRTGSGSAGFVAARHRAAAAVPRRPPARAPLVAGRGAGGRRARPAGVRLRARPGAARRLPARREPARRRRRADARRCVELGHSAAHVSAIASAAALAWRFRRSRGVERQQLKWIATAAALAVVAFIANAVLDQAFGVISQLPAAAVPARACPAAATRGDPALPALRPRADRQPHARLRRADARRSAPPTSASCC